VRGASRSQRWNQLPQRERETKKGRDCLLLRERIATNVSGKDVEVRETEMLEKRSTGGSLNKKGGERVAHGRQRGGGTSLSKGTHLIEGAPLTPLGRLRL